MTQVFVAIIIVYGSIFNLVSMPWLSTLSVLERRRNSIATIFLVAVFIAIVTTTVLVGLQGLSLENQYEIQDWVTILLPLLLASTFIMETVSTLVRQIEMMEWIRRALAHTVPISWMFRTMTVKDKDMDGQWLRSKKWAPWEYPRHNESIYNSEYFWKCTSRESSLFSLFQKWFKVIKSAIKHIWSEFHSRNSNDSNLSRNPKKTAYFYIVKTVYLTILVGMFIASSILIALSSLEVLLLTIFDYIWWLSFAFKPIIITRYDAMHLGREEMQEVFETTKTLTEQISIKNSPNAGRVLNRVMTSVLTTASVYENAFRKAYLVTPVYKLSISNRRVMRTKYEEIGCDPDILIRRVRAILEKRHSAGLLSITDSTTSTIEATLHDNIEAVLTVSLFFPTGTLYRIASTIADIEWQIEGRINSSAEYKPEMRLREQVVYIDSRNAMFWLLWVLVTEKWEKKKDCIENSIDGETDETEYEENEKIVPDDEVALLYIIATFLSRCRYVKRFGFNEEEKHYHEVRSLSITHGIRKISRKFDDLSKTLLKYRQFTIFEWLTVEYGIDWVSTSDLSSISCEWDAESGVKRSAKISLCP